MFVASYIKLRLPACESLLSCLKTVVLSIIALCVFAQTEIFSMLLAEEPNEARFVRVLYDEKHVPLSLQTSIGHYVLPAAVSAAPSGAAENIIVDLIAAVHLADSSYYQKLNQQFKSYDAVLYELVASKDALSGGAEQQDALKQDRAANPSAITATQLGMAAMLKLSFQLNEIDYTAANFVHADMSPQEFTDSMQRRDESLLKLFMRVGSLSQIAQMGSESRPPDLASMLRLASASTRALALKRLMAPEFTQMESMATMIDGPKGSTLVSQRNAVVMKVLAREIKKGKKSLAVFYGGAHMPDMEKRLLSEFGAQKEGQTWITAWDMQR